jgi:predicted oxidoreductase
MPTRREFLTQTAATGFVVAASVQLAKAAMEDTSEGPKTPLKTYQIPHTNLVVSRIAYGCAMVGMDWNDPDFIAKTVPLINTAYDNGVTFFDLADIYGFGKAESALGQVLKQSPGLRQKIAIQTKCGTWSLNHKRFDPGRSVDNGNQYRIIDNTYEHIVSSVEGSLKRLGVDHIDILLLHWPDSLVVPEEVAKAFDELKRSGKVRYFGVSNHNPLQIELLKKHVRQPLVISQIQLGLAHWYATAEPLKAALTHGDEGVVTLDYCRVHDMQVQAYSPIRASNIGKPANLLNPAPDASKEVKDAATMLADLAQKNNVSPAAIMLGWLLHHPAGIVPIIGATKPEHVIDNLGANRVSLTREEWYGLLQAAAAI